MKSKGLKIFAYFAAAIMLVSILSAGALAASDNGMNGNNDAAGNDDDNTSVESQETEDDDAPGIQQQDRDRDMVNADVDAPRIQKANAVRNKVNSIKDAQANYKEAKANFAEIKANDKNLESEEALQAAKDYLNDTIDYMIGIIEGNENIDGSYVDELQAEKEELADATTRKELAESARDINKIWKDARKEQVVDAAKNINNKMGSVLKTSNSLIVRLEKEIQRMEDNGEDTDELREMLKDYEGLIADAEENYEQARNTFRTGNEEYGESLRYMNEAGQNINQANLVLKNMLHEMKQHREGVITISGTGTLEADGSGTAVLSGDLTLSFYAEDAKLVVKGMSDDVEVDTGEAQYDSSNIDSGNSSDNNRAFVYHNITGDVTISGSSLTVMLRGDNISLTAEGTGTAVLAGEGSYTVTGDGETNGEWAEKQYDADEEEDVEEEEEVETAGADSEEEADDDSGDDDPDNGEGSDDGDSDENEDDGIGDGENTEQSS